MTLFVDPSRPSGGGPATYRCSRGETLLWSGERPYTLWEAGVTDEGVVAGYAFGAGYEGGREDSLTIVVLAPDGKARLEERSPREGCISDVGSPNPMIAGLLLDLEGDRLLVRVQTEAWGQSESWWTYGLSSGEAGVKIDPRAGLDKDERLCRIDELRLVPETGLYLARWKWLDFDKGQYGAVFTLLDREGRLAWRLDWPSDHVLKDRAAEQSLDMELREKGAILATAPGRFTLRQVEKNEQVTFALERVSGKRETLDVREVERRPFAGHAENKPATPVAPALALRHLGTISLAAPVPASPIRDVMSFDLDGQGRPGFLRRTGERFEFVRVERDGSNAVEVNIPPAGAGDWWSYELAWCHGERWVVTGTSSKSKGAWWIDARTRTLSAIEGFRGPEVESLAGTADGGFVALGGTSYDSGYFTNDLVFFGPDGKQRFTLGGDQGDPGDPRTLFSPEAVTVLANGELVILDNTQDLLQFFSASGEFLRAVELAAVWGREPNYPTGIHPDLDGGLILHDFNGSPSIVRLDHEGKIRTQFEPHFPDGGRFPIRSDVQAGPDGSLWTSDGHAFLRLDSAGVVQEALGAAPDQDTLGKIARLTLGPGDRIYAADRRTAAVHVFGPDGTRERVCRPAVGDFDGELSLPSLTVTDSGEVYLEKLHFAADGKRLGLVDLPGSQYSFDAYAQRGSERLWVLDGDQLRLLGPDGAGVRTIERAPDGTWLRGLDTAAVAPDGSLALATSAHFGEGTPGIHLYMASGDPLRSIAAPEGMAGWAPFAFDGQHLAIGVRREGRSGSVVWLDVRGNTLGTFTPPGETECWIAYLTTRAKELWLFDLEASRIERYSLP